jgi:ankyrin repeat protein
MAQSVHSFDRMFIAAPCDADWDSMIGNSRVRFCQHCNLHVTNLSEITRPEAMRLVAQSEGRLCLRFERRSDGSVLTKQAASPLHQIGRRASRLAAGAFGATLSLATGAAAQVNSRGPHPTAVTEGQSSPQKQKASGASANLRGTIFDSSGEAVVINASVRLVNTATGAELAATTSDTGEYAFENVPPGIYSLNANAPGFARYELFDMKVGPGDRQVKDVQLQARAMLMGVVGIAEPKDPLVKAALKNDLESVKQLITVSLNIDASDEYTDTNALSYAVENNNREMIQLLLSAGANPNATNRRGATPLMYLTSEANVELIRDLIVAGADLNAHNESGETPLMRAVAHSSFSVAKELIDAGADINARDESGNTLLMDAVQNNDPEVLKFLLSAGLPVDSTNDNGETALTLAARWEQGKNLDLLLDAGGGAGLTQEQLDGALAAAAGNEDSEIVRTLLRLGASANAKDGDTTALMEAAQNGRTEIIKILIAAGADVNAVDEDGATALMLADDLDSLRALLDAGANPSIRNKDGETALAMAIEYQRDDVVKLLKSRGARK